MKNLRIPCLYKKELTTVENNGVPYFLYREYAEPLYPPPNPSPRYELRDRYCSRCRETYRDINTVQYVTNTSSPKTFDALNV